MPIFRPNEKVKFIRDGGPGFLYWRADADEQQTEHWERFIEAIKDGRIDGYLGSDLRARASFLPLKVMRGPESPGYNITGPYTPFFNDVVTGALSFIGAVLGSSKLTKLVFDGVDYGWWEGPTVFSSASALRYAIASTNLWQHGNVEIPKRFSGESYDGAPIWERVEQIRVFYETRQPSETFKFYFESIIAFAGSYSADGKIRVDGSIGPNPVKGEIQGYYKWPYGHIPVVRSSTNPATFYYP